MLRMNQTHSLSDSLLQSLWDAISLRLPLAETHSRALAERESQRKRESESERDCVLERVRKISLRHNDTIQSYIYTYICIYVYSNVYIIHTRTDDVMV